MAFKASATIWHMPCAFIFHWARKLNVLGVRRYAQYIEGTEIHREVS